MLWGMDHGWGVDHIPSDLIFSILFPIQGEEPDDLCEETTSMEFQKVITDGQVLCIIKVENGKETSEMIGFDVVGDQSQFPNTPKKR